MILLAAFSVKVYAQEVRSPSFDSFSYLRDPVFNGTSPREPVAPALTQECDALAAEPEPRVAQQACPEITRESALSEQERFELQLALDKALSQILKLTVDYEALLARVQSFELRTGEGPEAYSQQGAAELEELMGLNAKRLADRDQQLAAQQTRLDALYRQYDNENASRKQLEKKVKELESESKKARELNSDNSKKVTQLTEQLEQKQSRIKQLKTELSAEKPGKVILPAEQKQVLTSLQVIDNDEGKLSPFLSSREWVIEGLRFKEGSADIELNSIQSLNVLISHLKKNPTRNVQVNGYTDSIGSAQSNLHLSQARANAVASYLTQQGIEFYRVKALGYGERRPLGDNAHEQGRLLNRRVAVLFLD